MVFVFSILLVLVTGFAPSLFTNANALDLDISDFECIAPVGNARANICSDDNSVTQETNNVVNSVTDNSDNSINDSFNPVNTCGNNSAEGNNATATFSNSTVTCNIDFGSDIAPSTLGLS